MNDYTRQEILAALRESAEGRFEVSGVTAEEAFEAVFERAPDPEDYQIDDLWSQVFACVG